MLEIRRGLGTKQMELHQFGGDYYLDIIAFGEFWTEIFKSIEEVKTYLKEGIYFLTNEEIENFIAKELEQ